MTWYPRKVAWRSQKRCLTISKKASDFQKRCLMIVRHAFWDCFCDPKKYTLQLAVEKCRLSGTFFGIIRHLLLDSKASFLGLSGNSLLGSHDYFRAWDAAKMVVKVGDFNCVVMYTVKSFQLCSCVNCSVWWIQFSGSNTNMNIFGPTFFGKKKYEYIWVDIF